MIPLSVPNLCGNELKYVKRCIKTEWISTAGHYISIFEKKVASHLGSKYAVACINGTSALQLAFLAIGLRPGEKLYEELLLGDNPSATDNPLILRAEEAMLDWATLKPILDQLQEATKNSDQEKVRELLIEAVPDFKPQCDISDLLFDNEQHP